MTSRPDTGARSRDISSRPPARHESQSRVRRVSDRSLPSTMPPRPLPTEAELAPLEWWLDAHMNVASNLLCLEQMRGADSIDTFLAPLGELRDALYELYCDSGDPRMRALQGADSALAAYVSGLYALCDEILEALSVVSAMRSDHPDLVQITADMKLRCAAFAQASSQLPDRAATALASVEVDDTNAVDPLRNVGEHFQDVVRAAGVLFRAELS
jgi:hypothetical protein